MNRILEEDIKMISSSNAIDWMQMKNKTIFITGATGLIGSCLVFSLLYANRIYNLNCNIIALVRNIEKAKEIFQYDRDTSLTFIQGDIRKVINVNQEIDYIIHAASQTNSKEFINNSLETIDISLKGTKNILNLAKEKKIKKIIFLSTMEIYGRPENDEKITERHGTDLMTNEIRNCYPISKIMCENLCMCYSKRYDFECNIARLTQTFGAGVRYDDSRVFAEFARCVIEGKNIVLHTKGETKRNYLYTTDAVTALLIILLKGENGEIYNVANENTYCTIIDMAYLVAANNPKIKVEIVLEDINKFGFAPTLHMNLDTSRLLQLGWKPTINLEEMYRRTIDYMKNVRKN